MLAFGFDGLGCVGGCCFDVFDGFHGWFLEVLDHFLGGVGDLGGQGLGCGFELVRGFAFFLARRDQGRDEQSGAEGDQAGGQGVALGFGFDLVRGVGDGGAGVAEFGRDSVLGAVQGVAGGVQGVSGVFGS